MRFGALLLLVLPLTAGCIYDELTTPTPTAAGGMVTAQMNGGAQKTTVALAHLDQDPPLLEGASSDLTVSITLGTDSSGADPKVALAQAGGAIQLPIAASSATRLEIHLNGSGCVANSGWVHLDSDAMNQIEGTFQATGMVFGGGAACSITGMLSAVPADR